ncbi:hypothetical protein L7F22_063469 [Adiantum nelumboides]|nr:hypothetical protein [Adiantum nelumboides]
MGSLGSLLLAGLEEGSIIVWRFDALSSSFQAVVSLSCMSTNHVFDDKNSKLSPVLSLEPCVQGSTIVYAGLANGTIQVWDVASASCCQVLSDTHSKAVIHLLTCDQLSALFSASQDGSIKMWTISGADSQYLELQKILNTVPNLLELMPNCHVLAMLQVGPGLMWGCRWQHQHPCCLHPIATIKSTF